MNNRTSTNISNAFSESVFVKVSSSDGEVLEQMVKPGDSKEFNTNYGQVQFQLSFLKKDESRFGYKSTRVKSDYFYTINIGSHNKYIIKKGETGLELLKEDVGPCGNRIFFRTSQDEFKRTN